MAAALVLTRARFERRHQRRQNRRHRTLCRTRQIARRSLYCRPAGIGHGGLLHGLLAVATTIATIAAISTIAARTTISTRTTVAAIPALAALTREMAADFGALGVRVNAIAPGEIDTAMLSPGTDKIVENIPMHRLGTPDEVAKIIYVLCTETSSYVNGAEIHINGGQHV